MYVKYTYLSDNQTPAIEGLVFEFALESEYPTSSPEFYGTCPANSIVVDAETITEERFNEAKASELQARKTLLTQRNNAAYENAISQMTHEYPPSEIQTWERQREEAVAWGVDPLSATPWIDSAAAARGVPREIYLSRTLAKITAFAMASAWHTGRRQGIEDQIRAADSFLSIGSVAIDYTLPGAGE